MGSRKSSSDFGYTPKNAKIGLFQTITHPPIKYQLVNPLANGSLFVLYTGQPTQKITLNTDPLTKSARDLSIKAQVLPHKAGQ